MYDKLLKQRKKYIETCTAYRVARHVGKISKDEYNYLMTALGRECQDLLLIEHGGLMTMFREIKTKTGEKIDELGLQQCLKTNLRKTSN